MPVPSLVNRLWNSFEVRATGKWFFLSSIVGAVVGLAAILFQLLSQLVMRYTLLEYAGYAVGEAANEVEYFGMTSRDIVPGMIVLIMTIGGLLTGLLVRYGAPEAAGAGTDAVIASFHNDAGRMRHRVPIVKTLASAITLGTGGSGGREGPIAQIGGGLGSYLCDKLNGFAGRVKLTDRDRRIMLAAGMAAGVGAIFRAPLAAALFAGEILYRDGDLESEAIVPAAISSIVGYSVYCLALPRHLWFQPLFGTNLGGSIVSPLELLPFAGLSIILVLAAILYVWSAKVSVSLFERMPGPIFLKPAVGACLAGLIGVSLYLLLARDINALTVLSVGYDTLQLAFESDSALTIRLLLLIGLAKIVTTSLTIGSGGSGGFFGPSMVIGGCLGAAFGKSLAVMFPGLISGSEVYALVGMAGFFAACANAPFSTIIMVSEMTGDYRLLLPSMWVSTLCALLSRRYSLYRNQVPNRIESPAHRGDFIVDLLEGIAVENVYTPDDGSLIRVPESMTLDQIVHLVSDSHQHYFPVVDHEDNLVGIFSADDVRAWYFNQSIWNLAVARDMMVTNLVSVLPGDDLNTAMQRFTALNLEELPVLDPENPGRLLGMLRRKETIAAYNRLLREFKQGGRKKTGRK